MASRKFHFTREEIAAELKRCGYPLTSDEDVERFERDLLTLYNEVDQETSSDKFYDLPVPSRDDIDFSKYYSRFENSKASATSCFADSNETDEDDLKKSDKGYSSFLGKEFKPTASKSAPNTSRGSVSTSLNTSKRKVLRKSDDGTSYIDELLFGRSSQTIPDKICNLPVLLGDEEDDSGSLDFGINSGKIPIEDKLSRMTLVSAGSAGDSPVMRRSNDVRSGRQSSASAGSCGPLQLSDRDNRQVYLTFLPFFIFFIPSYLLVYQWQNQDVVN